MLQSTEYDSRVDRAKSPRNKLVLIILLICIPLAMFEAWWIAPERPYYKEMDFAVFYSAGKMFAMGQNPYDRAKAEDVWKAADGDAADADEIEYPVMDVIFGPLDSDHPEKHWLPVEVIPPGLAVFSVISAFNVPTAWPLWNAIVALLFAGQLYATVRLMRRPFLDPASLGMIIFTILLEPLHIGLANGQPTVPTISLLILALWWNTINRQTLAGIAFAIATALKPQLAAPFVILFVYQGKWKTVWVAAAVGIALTAIGVLQMQLHHQPWLSSWINEVRFAEQSDGIDDARTNNLGRSDLLYLALLGHLITDNAAIVNAMSFTVFASLVTALLICGRPRRESLGLMAGFSVLALLPMYHRFYDAGIITLPIAWALCNLKPRNSTEAISHGVPTLNAPSAGSSDRATTPAAVLPYESVHQRRTPNFSVGTRWPAIIILIVAAAFVIPAEWLLTHFRTVDENGWVAHSWWFNGILEPHHAWELLTIFASLFTGVVSTRYVPEQPLLVFAKFTRQTWQKHGLRIALAAVIPLALFECWWITPSIEDGYKPMDFAMYYTAGRMFVLGMNPYDRIAAEDVWDDADTNSDYYDVMDFVFGANDFDENAPGVHWLPINLIPAGIAVMSPLARLDVEYAWPLWNSLVAMLLAAQLFAVTRLMGKPFWHSATLSLIIIELLMDPLHVGLANGQPAVPAIALIIISLWLAKIDWQICAGIALAVATALKPQLAGPFAIYFLWQRRYKTVGCAAGVGVALLLMAIVPMHLKGVHWVGSWASEVHYAERPGGINDPRVENEGRQDMIHLPLLLHMISDNATLVNAMSVIVIGCFGGILFIKAGKQKQSLAALAGFSVLALLPVYHRLYDAGILMILIAWAVCNLTGRYRWQAWLSLVFLSGFFVSQAGYETVFQSLEDHQWIVDSWWFNLILEPHNPLQLLGMFFCVLSAVAKAEKPDPVIENAAFPVTLTPATANFA